MATAQKRERGYAGKRDAAGIAEPTTWRMALDKARAEIARLELEQLRGTLVARAEVDASQSATAQVIQTDLRGLGRKIAPLLVGLKVNEIQEAIDRECREMVAGWMAIPTTRYRKPKGA